MNKARFSVIRSETLLGTDVTLKDDIRSRIQETPAGNVSLTTEPGTRLEITSFLPKNLTSREVSKNRTCPTLI